MVGMHSARMLKAALLAGVLLVSGCAKDPPAGQPAAAYSVLDQQASQLRADFNRQAGRVRLLFVVDPICPGCLRGLADMNRDLLSTTADPRLQVFVVYEPVLGVARYVPWLRIAGGKDIPRAARLIHNPNVHSYWSPSGAFGRLLSRGVGLENHGRQVYAWDVWLLYGPEAKWDPSGPPRPQLLMHQLSALRGSTFPHLDSRVFAQRVRALLTSLPTDGPAQALAARVHP
jgi:outer membrane murein-binding lipoprotein Lpp